MYVTKDSRGTRSGCATWPASIAQRSKGRFAIVSARAEYRARPRREYLTPTVVHLMRRADRHDPAPPARREFDTERAAERVSDDVHFFKPHAIELRLDAVDEGFDRRRNLRTQCRSAGGPMQRRDAHAV